MSVQGSYVVNAATKHPKEAIAFLNSFARARRRRLAGSRTCSCRPGSRRITPRSAGRTPRTSRSSARRARALSSTLARRTQVMEGKPKEVFTQVFNNAFPAGSISVEDAVKQMNAAYAQVGRERWRAVVAPAPSASKRLLPRASADRQPWGAIVAFLLPAFTIYTALTAYPVLRTFWNSFHKVLPRSETFVGLDNYAALAVDDIFWRSVKNTFVWACASPLAEVSIALLLALALYAKIPGTTLLPHRLVHAGAHVVRRGRHHLGVDLQLRLGRGQRDPARRSGSDSSRRRGSAIRRSRCRR